MSTRIGSAQHNPHRRLPPESTPARAIIYKAKAESLSAAEQLIVQLESKLAASILQALLAQKESIDLDAIVAALQTGNVAKVLELLELPKALAGFDVMTAAVQNGANTAGAAAAASVRLTGASFAFNQLNPRLITWLQTYNLGLIRQINEQTKEGVRAALIDGMKAGENPKEVARQVKGIVGLTDRQAKAVANYRKQLETFHLKRSAGSFGLGNKVNRVNGTQVSILDADGNNTDGINARRLRDYRFDGQMRRAMETGKPLSKAQIDKMVAAYERKYLAYRSRTIARTEATRTTNMGIQDAWQQAIDKGAVKEDLTRKMWIVARDERTCEVCGPIPKMNPKKGIKHAQSFATPDGPVTRPPMHPNCRCTIFYRVYEPQQLGEGQ